MANYKIGSLFSGIGGIDLAFQSAGFDIAWQVEIEEFCQQVLSKNFPHVPKYRDIYDCDELSYVDVITAGFPCQPFSVAGLRQGADDERFLIPRMLEVIDYVQPKMVFLENVPGFASLNAGNEFRQLLRQVAHMGFDAQWGHCRASDIAAPHRRERWFLVGYSSGIGLQRDKQRDNIRGNTKKRCENRILTNIYARNTTQGERTTHGLHERKLGRTLNGIPERLDEHQFPARRNKVRFEWEPKLTTKSSKLNRDRIKALGNAVVPQVIYPIALEMFEYLKEQKCV